MLRRTRAASHPNMSVLQRGQTIRGMWWNEDDCQGRCGKSDRAAVLVLLPSWVGWLITHGPKKFHRNQNIGWHEEHKRVVPMASDQDMRSQWSVNLGSAWNSSSTMVTWLSACFFGATMECSTYFQLTLSPCTLLFPFLAEFFFYPCRSPFPSCRSIFFLSGLLSHIVWYTKHECSTR